MSIYQKLAEMEAAGTEGVLCTVVNSQGSTPRHAGSKMLVYPDGKTAGSVGGGEVESRVIQAALQMFGSGKAVTLSYSLVDPSVGDPGLCGGTLEVFIEPIRGKPVLLIAGGGHVGKAVAHLSQWLGFKVVVTDDRAEFCTPEANPEADELFNVALERVSEVVSITANTYIVLTTRGVDVDVVGLPEILKTPAAYIGVIGSKRRWMTTRKGLLDAGITEDQLSRIQSPIGLELNAETPEEIAVSILAEIIMLRNGGSGVRMHL
jgi:xanthine dehydrogenase accessory factor